MAAVAFVKVNKVDVNSVGISVMDLEAFRAGLYEVKPIVVDEWQAHGGCAEWEQCGGFCDEWKSQVDENENDNTVAGEGWGNHVKWIGQELCI